MAPTAAAAEAATTVDAEAEEEEELDCLVLLVELDGTCDVDTSKKKFTNRRTRNSEKVRQPNKAHTMPIT